MVEMVQKLVDGYPSVVNAENKNTQVSCFFLNILDKLRNLNIFLIHYIGERSILSDEQEREFCNYLMLCSLVTENQVQW